MVSNHYRRKYKLYVKKTFEEIKKVMAKETILNYPNFSEVAVGAVV